MRVTVAVTLMLVVAIVLLGDDFPRLLLGL